jgi:putative addiction module killer protein
MIEIRKTEIFAKWLDGLKDIRARARLLARIERLAAGNPGDVALVGEGISELRIDYAPGSTINNLGNFLSFYWLAGTNRPRPKTLKLLCVWQATCRSES